MSYEDGDACHYNIRGLDYMKTKAKVRKGGGRDEKKRLR